jgi:spore coat polysaccharide biosynthesis protein SpsF (cytidylyltransferase family)
VYDLAEKTVVIIQARMGSTRLPGKSLADVCGNPLIWHVVQRAKQAKSVDEVIIATSVDSSDDLLYDFAVGNGIKCIRGNLEDVLDRYHYAAKKSGAGIIVRITGDSPLVDPVLIDSAVNKLKDEDRDYISNSQQPWMDGFDVEAFRFSALEKAWNEAELASEREHVTVFIRNHPEKFDIGYMKNDPWFGDKQLSVDRNNDLELIRKIYSEMLKKGLDHKFSYKDVKQLFFDNPELADVNKSSIINEGYLKSLKEDKKVK